MKDSDLQVVYLPDGRAAFRCETIDAFRATLRRVVQLEYRNSVTIANARDFITDEIEHELINGDVLLSARQGFPGKVRTVHFLIPGATVRAYQAGAEQPETEPKPPAGWEFASELALDLEPAQ